MSNVSVGGIVTGDCLDAAISALPIHPAATLTNNAAPFSWDGVTQAGNIPQSPAMTLTASGFTFTSGDGSAPVLFSDKYVTGFSISGNVATITLSTGATFSQTIPTTIDINVQSFQLSGSDLILTETDGTVHTVALPAEVKVSAVSYAPGTGVITVTNSDGTSVSATIDICASLNSFPTGSAGVPGATLLLGKDCEWHTLPVMSNTQLVANDSQTIDFTTSGTDNHTVTAAVKVSATAGNALVANVDGLYVPVNLDNEARAWGSGDVQRFNSDSVLVTDSIFHTGFVTVGAVNSTHNANSALDVRTNLNVGQNNNVFNGANSIAVGDRNTAGNNAVATGTLSEATGVRAVAMGSVAKATGNFSAAFNAATTASGVASSAFGSATSASGQAAQASGTSSIASAGNSHAMNDRTTASGAGSLATGSQTIASGQQSAAFNKQTAASGDNSAAFGAETVAGGTNSFAGGDRSKALGIVSYAFGTISEANNPESIALGHSSIVNHDGAMLWSGISVTPFNSAANNELAARADGGIRLYTANGLTSGVTMPAGTSAWVAVSDSRTKQGFIPVNLETVLEKIKHLGVNTYQTKASQGTTNIGANADEFNGLFGDMITPKMVDGYNGLSHQDVDGVLLAAVKGLLQRVDALTEQVTLLKLSQNQA